jgi:hypothetical protein
VKNGSLGYWLHPKHLRRELRWLRSPATDTRLKAMIEFHVSYDHRRHPSSCASSGRHFGMPLPIADETRDGSRRRKYYVSESAPKKVSMD